MSTELDALHSLRNFARQVRPLLALDDKLKEYASLEVAITEAKTRLAALTGKEKDAEFAIAARHHELDAAITTKHLVADREIEEKHRIADEVVAKAEDQAGGIVAAARKEAAGFAQEVERHRVMIAEHKNEATRVKGVIKDHDDLHRKVIADINAANVEHARVQAMIADLKAKF
jgi:hypothetical protein